MNYAIVLVNECSGNHVERELTIETTRPRDITAKWFIISNFVEVALKSGEGLGGGGGHGLSCRRSAATIR
jgi:hypothetical protein